MKGYMGTKPYMAPEIIAKKNYQGQDVDLFAVAAVLFVMLSGAHPFTESASKSDYFYKFFTSNKLDLFWKAHEISRPKGFFTKEFKSLINHMFQEQPSSRLTTAEFIHYPWMMQETASE